MKNTLISSILVSLTLLSSMQVKAEEKGWVVHLPAITVSPNEESKLTTNKRPATTAIPFGAKLNVSDNTAPKIDISYYFNQYMATELILPIGTEHNIQDNQLLANVDTLAPAMQCHFNPDELFDPYLGTDIKDPYTRSSRGGITGNKIKIDKDSWDAALQANTDINLSNDRLINTDYLDIDTDIALRSPSTGNVWRKVSSPDSDSWMIVTDIGKRFN